MNEQQHVLDPRPVTVLTGFLGAGKTSLLNAILADKKGTRFAIIENEVGEIGIDGELIVKESDSFTELSNGCICCSINASFIDTLRDLSKRTDWDELIIEATGVANPGGIITPFKQLDWIKKYFIEPHVICVVDTVNIEEQLQLSETTGAQLAFADVIFLNKIDLSTTNELDRLKLKLKKMNPLAKVELGNRSNIPLQSLLEKVSTFRLPILSIGQPVTQTHEHEHFDSVSLSFEKSFDRDRLLSRLHAFILFQAKDVYRFKSVFFDSNFKNRIVVQSVMKSIVIEEGRPWEVDENKNSVFVFIGKNLQSKGFERMLKQCLSK